MRPRARHLPAPLDQRRERGRVDLLLLELEGIDAPEVLGPRRGDLVRQRVLGLLRGALIELRLRAPQVLREAAAGVQQRARQCAHRHQPRVPGLAPQVVDIFDGQRPARRRECDIFGEPPRGLARTWLLGQQHALAPGRRQPGGGLQVGPQRAQVVLRLDLPRDIAAAQQVVEQRRQPHDHQRAPQPDLARDREVGEPDIRALERAILRPPGPL